MVGLQTFATSVLAAMLPMMRLVRLFARGQHQDNGGQSEGGIWIKAAVPVARPEKHQVLSMGLVTLSRLFVQSLISFLFANPVCGKDPAAKTAGVVRFGLPPGRLVVAPAQIHIPAPAVAPLDTTRAARSPSQLAAAILARPTVVIDPTKITRSTKHKAIGRNPMAFCIGSEKSERPKAYCRSSVGAD